MTDTLYRMRGLEWKEFTKNGYIASVPIGDGAYRIYWDQESRTWWVALPFGIASLDKLDSLEAAQSAAEAHYRARMAEGLIEVVPNMFWEDDADGDNAVDDPSDIADRLDLGSVFRLQCARSMPDRYYVAISTEEGCSDTRPADADEISAFKKGEAELLAMRRAKIDAENERRRSAAEAAVKKEPEALGEQVMPRVEGKP